MQANPFACPQEDLIDIAQKVLDCRLTLDRVAMGGHKRVLLCASAARDYAISFACPSKRQMVRSGVGIRQALRAIDLRFPQHWLISEGGTPFIVVVEDRIDGIDLEHCLPSIDRHQAIVLARDVADVVKKSTHALSSVQGPPLVGHHFLGERPLLGHARDFYLNGLEMARANYSNKQATHMLPALLELIATAPSCDFFDCLVQTFVWDVLERNVMVSNGKMSGIVDQDTLLSADMWKVPAWANVYLAMAGMEFVDDYVSSWFDHWEGSQDDKKRFLLYRACYALFQDSRAGWIESSGRVKKSVPADKLRAWVDEALALSV